MKTLTVSIAAYNMEKYIEEALTSLTDERIVDKLEIFVVDDGGVDRTLEIAQTFAQKYPKSVFPVHKENGGYGSTVNYSIQHASGKYFKTLDGDDWFDRKGLYQLVQLLETTDADVISTETQSTCETRQQLKNLVEMSTYKVERISEIQSLRVLGHQSLTYKTEVLRNSGVRLPEHILYTDGIYMVVPFHIAETILVTDFIVYYYRVDREGQSISKESRIKHKDDQVEVQRQLMHFCARDEIRSHPNYAYIKKVVNNIYMITMKTLLIQPVCKATQQEIIDFEIEMKALSDDIFSEDKKGSGKLGFFLHWMRKTNYHIYWILKFIPENLKNK